MERRGRNAVVMPLATTGSPTAAYLLVTLVSLFGSFPELEARTIEANPVEAREAETSRASNHPVIPLGLDLYLPVRNRRRGKSGGTREIWDLRIISTHPPVT